MKYTGIMLLFVILLLPVCASAYDNPYGKYYTYEVYYNGEKIELDAPKPVLKIEEPFTIKFEMTVYQESKVSIDIEDLGTGLGMENFVVIEGPSQLGESISRVYSENETQTYEWTLKATDEWAGGSIPIEIHYSIIEKYNPEPLVDAGFTAVLPYISTEYYETPETTPAEPPETDTNKTPAFTLPAALLAIALVALRKKC